MAACIWDCVKYQLGFFGAIALIGVLLAALAALGVTTGGTGYAALILLLEGIMATTMGSVGLTAAAVGGAGVIGSLIGCIAKCILD